LGLAERFGQSPYDVLAWDSRVLHLLAVEAAGRPDDEQAGEVTGGV
jgi:hypothetical protein